VDSLAVCAKAAADSIKRARAAESGIRVMHLACG
jgi:hypothetical protein